MSISNLLEQASILLPSLIISFGKENLETVRASGGFLCIYDLRSSLDDPPAAIVRYGLVPRSDLSAQLNLSLHNAQQLLVSPNCESSWQCRAPERGVFGGAIRGADCIASFAGVSEFVDEALVLKIMSTCSSLSLAAARRIAAISRNPYFFPAT